MKETVIDTLELPDQFFERIKQGWSVRHVWVDSGLIRLLMERPQAKILGMDGQEKTPPPDLF